MIKSASRSSIANNEKFRSMAVGNVPSSEFLIETLVVPAGGAANVTFNNLSQHSSTYRHLQIVYTEFYTIDGFSSTMQLNGDSAGNYNSHGLLGTGSAVSSAFQGPNATAILYNHFAIGHSSNTNIRTVGVIDILDAFNTSKFTTVRSFGGQVGPGANLIFMHSGLWRNTAALTQITLATNGTPQLAADSRFSLYGVTA